MGCVQSDIVKEGANKNGSEQHNINIEKSVAVSVAPVDKDSNALETAKKPNTRTAFSPSDSSGDDNNDPVYSHSGQPQKSNDENTSKRYKENQEKADAAEAENNMVVNSKKSKSPNFHSRSKSRSRSKAKSRSKSKSKSFAANDKQLNANDDLEFKVHAADDRGATLSGNYSFTDDSDSDSDRESDGDNSSAEIVNMRNTSAFRHHNEDKEEEEEEEEEHFADVDVDDDTPLRTVSSDHEMSSSPAVFSSDVADEYHTKDINHMMDKIERMEDSLSLSSASHPFAINTSPKKKEQLPGNQRKKYMIVDIEADKKLYEKNLQQSAQGFDIAKFRRANSNANNDSAHITNKSSNAHNSAEKETTSKLVPFSHNLITESINSSFHSEMLSSINSTFSNNNNDNDHYNNKAEDYGIGIGIGIGSTTQSSAITTADKGAYPPLSNNDIDENENENKDFMDADDEDLMNAILSMDIM